MRKLLVPLFLLVAAGAHADQLNPPPGGSSTLTSNSTATSGFSAGQLPYSDGSKLQALGQGSAGQFLQSNGAGATPTWATPAGGGNVSTNGTITTGTLGVWNTLTGLGTLANGSNGQYLGISGGVLTWSTPAGSGTVTSSGPPTTYQIPAWTSGTNLQGIGPCSTTTLLHGQGAAAYPTCAQVNLASDVTGNLALASLATGALPVGVTVNNANWSGTGLSNANLANASTTVAGQTCTLGSSCSVAYSNLSSGAPTATNSVLGLVKPDGTTIANTAGAISVAYGTTAGTAAQGNDSRITGAVQSGGALGTPSSGTLTNTTGYPASSLASGAIPATATINNSNWSGTVLSAANGGTGVANGSSTITLGGNLSTAGAVSFSGAYSFAGTLTAATAVTFPTSGTLFANPMTTAGDLILGGASGAPGRLGIGSNGTCLTSNGTTASWGSCATGAITGAGAAGQLASWSSGSSLTGTANATVSGGALTLGASGTAGSIQMGNATSGTVTLQPVAGALGAVTASLPANTGTVAETNLAQSWSAVQTFAAGDISLTGATTGCATFTGTILSSTGTACGGSISFPQTVGGTTTQWAIPYFSTTTQLSSLSSPGTTTTVLHGNASGAPSFGAVSLASDVTGNLALASLATGALPSGVTVNNSNWSGTVLSATNGGTGVNNGTSTLTLGGALTTTGAATPTLAFGTGAYTYTFPAATGQLALINATQNWPSGQAFISPPTQLALGQLNTYLGQMALYGGTSGYVYLQAQAAAGAGAIFALPTTNGASGQLLKTDGAGNTSWAANLSFSSPTLTIGTQGSVLGQLALASSGASFTTTLAPASSGTSYTLTLPQTAGSVSQCLQNNGTTPGVLTFGSCGGGSPTITAGTTATSGFSTTPAEAVLTSKGSLVQSNTFIPAIAAAGGMANFGGI